MKKSGPGGDKGFTLWEIVVVIFLTGLILGSIVPRYESSRAKTSEKVDLTNIRLIEEAARLYRLDLGVFPTTVDDLMLNNTDSADWQGPYLEHWPRNPDDETRVYKIDSLGRVY
jgi:general secretion pathway protein G